MHQPNELVTGVWARHPINPTEHVKRQFYELYQNIFLVMPGNNDIRPYYSYIKKYPVTPYLDSRDSLMQWLFFIRRHVDESMGVEYMGVEYLMAEYNAEYVLRDDSEYRAYTVKRIATGIGIVVVLGIIARRA